MLVIMWTFKCRTQNYMHSVFLKLKQTFFVNYIYVNLCTETNVVD